MGTETGLFLVNGSGRLVRGWPGDNTMCVHGIGYWTACGDCVLEGEQVSVEQYGVPLRELPALLRDRGRKSMKLEG